MSTSTFNRLYVINTTLYSPLPRVILNAYFIFIKNDLLSKEWRGASIQVAWSDRIRKQSDMRISSWTWTFVKRVRSVKVPIADLSCCSCRAAQGSYQFFLPSLSTISRASTAILSIAATCETLGFYALSWQIPRARARRDWYLVTN